MVPPVVGPRAQRSVRFWTAVALGPVLVGVYAWRASALTRSALPGQSESSPDPPKLDSDSPPTGTAQIRPAVSPELDSRSREELFHEARRAGVSRTLVMSKEQLAKALLETRRRDQD